VTLTWKALTTPDLFKAIVLFILLFILAIPLGALFDFLLKIFKIRPSAICNMHTIHKQDHARNYKHYFTVHIWQHIFRKHIIRITYIFFLLLLLQMVKVGLQLNQHVKLQL